MSSSLVKYPSTPYLPWTAQADDNDVILDTANQFENKIVVVTEKMDGENTTLYHDHYHARSVDSRHHPSRDYVKAFWGGIRFNIPENVRICGENVYAEHSLAYDNLQHYFLGFSAWYQDTNWCLPWDETLNLFRDVGITPVPTVYVGVFDYHTIHNTWLAEFGGPEFSEGYVIRTFNGFYREEFNTSLGKYVRENHVQTDEHWTKKPVVPNKLA